MQNEQTELSKVLSGRPRGTKTRSLAQMKIDLQFVLQFLLKRDKYLMKYGQN